MGTLSALARAAPLSAQAQTPMLAPVGTAAVALPMHETARMLQTPLPPPQYPASRSSPPRMRATSRFSPLTRPYAGPLSQFGLPLGFLPKCVPSCHPIDTLRVKDMAIPLAAVAANSQRMRRARYRQVSRNLERRRRNFPDPPESPRLPRGTLGIGADEIVRLTEDLLGVTA